MLTQRAVLSMMSDALSLHGMDRSASPRPNGISIVNLAAWYQRTHAEMSIDAATAAARAVIADLVRIGYAAENAQHPGYFVISEAGFKYLEDLRAIQRAAPVGTAAHDAKPYPHPGGCGLCHHTKVCNYCGAPKRGLGCTNGRCGTCHRAICTPGGETAAGHGFGKQGR